MIRLDIPSPCGESIADMTPTERGRYCGACQREILDFTGFTDEQLYRYFMAATEKGEIPCGFFRPDQLGRSYASPARPGAYARTWRALGMMMAGLMSAHAADAQTAPAQPDTLTMQDTVPDWSNRPRFVEGWVRDSTAGVGISYCLVEIQGKNYYYVRTDEEGYFKIDMKADEPEEGVLKLKAQALGYPAYQTQIDNLKAVLPVTMAIRMESGLEIRAQQVRITRDRTVVGLLVPYTSKKLTFWQRVKHFFHFKHK